MKHIFIINPTAGLVDRTTELLDRIKACFDALSTEYYVFVTEEPKHATEIVKTMCGFSNQEKVRFYSCGGDGTLFEVINGIADFANTEVAMLPTGKYNDMLAVFGNNAAAFGSLPRLVQGRAVPLDAMRVNDAYYALNKVCLGIDANIAADAHKILYTYLRSFSSLLTAWVLAFKHCLHLHDHVYVMTFDEQIKTAPWHFAVIMNASRHAARFFQAKHSRVEADALKVIAVKSSYDVLGIAQFLDCEVGRFPEAGAGASLLEGRSFEVRRKDAEKMLLSMDGETVFVDCVRVRGCPGLIKFVIPSDEQGDF